MLFFQGAKCPHLKLNTQKKSKCHFLHHILYLFLGGRQVDKIKVGLIQELKQ